MSAKVTGSGAKDATGKDADDPKTLSAKKTSNRPYSIVVWGATGFTGSLVCKQIAQEYPGQFKWAIAGRSSEKLVKLREELAKISPECEAVPILTADLNDNKSLDRLVKQSDVLVSTAGPFWNIGAPLVEASLRNSTHYCDIAGEVHFMRKTVTGLHAAAAAKNVKIVHSCGFDSVPSDLGTLLLVDHMRSELQRPCARVDLLVNDIKGAQSGGSIQSMFEQYMLPAEEITLCEDPYCLNPPQAEGAGPRKKPTYDETDQFGMRYNKRLNRWTYPFQFSAINSRVVRRSAAFLAYPKTFKYSEAHEAEGPVDALLGAMGHTCVHLFSTVPFLRAIVTPLLPKPGDGPPEAFRERNHWKFTLYGWTLEEGRARPKQCQAVVQGRRDPGYLETSRMVLEAALCLALQGAELKEKGLLQGGVLTPATAMGSVLTERLKKAQIKFEITKTGKEVPSSPLDKLKAGPAGDAARAKTAAGAGTAAPTVSLREDLHASHRLGCLEVAADADVGRARQCVHIRGPWGHCREFVGRGMAHAHPAVRLAQGACEAHVKRIRCVGDERAWEALSQVVPMAREALMRHNVLVFRPDLTVQRLMPK